MSNESSGPTGWTQFWFAPIPTTGLAVVRVMSGLLFAFWLLTLLGQQSSFFTKDGWLDKQGFQSVQKHQFAMEQQQEALSTPIGWSLLYSVGDNAALFQSVYWAAIAIFLMFALGIATRLTGVLTWVLVVSFLASPAIAFEGDYLLAILAFYLMVGHLLLHQWSDISPFERVLGTRDQFVFYRWIAGNASVEPRTSVAANWMLRLLQIHFVIIMMTSGFHKLQMGDWWSGAALWYPLHPTMQTTMESLEREKASAFTVMFFVSLIGYLLIAWQIALPVFAWRTGVTARVLFFGGALLGWAGMLYYISLPLFGPFICIACLSFLSPNEWSWIRARIQGMFGTQHESVAARSAKQTPVMAGSHAIQKK